MAIADDIATVIRQRCPSVKNVYTDAIAQTRNPVHGIWVTQRQTSSDVRPLHKVSTVYVDIVVRGEGMGEAGRNNAYNDIMTVFKAMNLVFDTVVNGTHFLKISPDSAPFEVQSGDGTHFDFQFGLQATIYYGE